MNKDIKLESIEITEKNTVIILERHHFYGEGVSDYSKLTHREIANGDDYSQESEKVKAICNGLFGLFHVEADVDSEDAEPLEFGADDSAIISPDFEAFGDVDLYDSEESDLDEQ